MKLEDRNMGTVEGEMHMEGIAAVNVILLQSL